MTKHLLRFIFVKMSAPETKLFTCQFPSSFTEDDLSTLFGKYGRVTECAIRNNFAFIHMSTIEEAKNAREALHDHQICGSKLVVKQSTSTYRQTTVSSRQTIDQNRTRTSVNQYEGNKRNQGVKPASASAACISRQPTRIVNNNKNIHSGPQETSKTPSLCQEQSLQPFTAPLTKEPTRTIGVGGATNRPVHGMNTPISESVDGLITAEGSMPPHMETTEQAQRAKMALNHYYTQGSHISVESSKSRFHHFPNQDLEQKNRCVDDEKRVEHFYQSPMETNPSHQRETNSHRYLGNYLLPPATGAEMDGNMTAWHPINSENRGATAQTNWATSTEAEVTNPWGTKNMWHSDSSHYHNDAWGPWGSNGPCHSSETATKALCARDCNCFQNTNGDRAMTTALNSSQYQLWGPTVPSTVMPNSYKLW